MENLYYLLSSTQSRDSSCFKAATHEAAFQETKLSVLQLVCTNVSVYACACVSACERYRSGENNYEYGRDIDQVKITMSMEEI